MHHGLDESFNSCAFVSRQTADISQEITSDCVTRTSIVVTGAVSDGVPLVGSEDMFGVELKAQQRAAPLVLVEV